MASSYRRGSSLRCKVWCLVTGLIPQCLTLSQTQDSYLSPNARRLNPSFVLLCSMALPAPWDSLETRTGHCLYHSSFCLDEDVPALLCSSGIPLLQHNCTQHGSLVLLSSSDKLHTPSRARLPPLHSSGFEPAHLAPCLSRCLGISLLKSARAIP